jgi:hypothetical protein
MPSFYVPSIDDLPTLHCIRIRMSRFILRSLPCSAAGSTSSTTAACLLLARSFSIRSPDAYPPKRPLQPTPSNPSPFESMSLPKSNSTTTSRPASPLSPSQARPSHLSTASTPSPSTPNRLPRLHCLDPETSSLEACLFWSACSLSAASFSAQTLPDSTRCYVLFQPSPPCPSPERYFNFQAS